MGNPDKLLDDTNLSDEFKDQAKRMSLFTLRDIIEPDVEILKKHPEYTDIWYLSILILIRDEKVNFEFAINQYKHQGREDLPLFGPGCL